MSCCSAEAPTRFVAEGSDMALVNDEEGTQEKFSNGIFVPENGFAQQDFMKVPISRQISDALNIF